jgi:hypothetical protein
MSIVYVTCCGWEEEATKINKHCKPPPCHESEKGGRTEGYDPSLTSIQQSWKNNLTPNTEVSILVRFYNRQT